MAKLINLNNFNKGFSDAFTPTFLQTQKLAQDESQYTRDMNFQNRQLQLGEAFRRDELKATVDYHNMQGEYYDVLERQGDERTKLATDENKATLFMQGWKQHDESMPLEPGTELHKIYGDSWIKPSEKPEELSRWEDGPFGSRVEAKGHYNEAGQWVNTNYETVVSPPIPTTTNDGGDGKGKFDTFYNEGLSYLAEIKSLHSVEAGGSKEYNEAKQKATFNTYQALDAAGVPRAVVEALRANIDGLSSASPETRRTVLNDAINNLQQQYELTPEQLKALKLWNDVGTR